MRTKVIAVILDIIVIIILLCFTKNIADIFFEGSRLDAVATIIPLLLILLTLQFSFLFFEFEKKVDNKITKFLISLSQKRYIEVLEQDTFYSHFRNNILTAKKAVDMAFLDAKAPTNYGLKGDETHDYYKNLCSMICKRSTVHFRRVELYNNDKTDWLEKLMKDFNGKRNFSLKILIPEHANQFDAHVSTQLIDNDKAYCVAVAEHQNNSAKRDIYISDEEATNLWRKYYNENLWDAGISLIEKGQVDSQKWQEVKNKYGTGK